MLTGSQRSASQESDVAGAPAPLEVSCLAHCVGSTGMVGITGRGLVTSRDGGSFELGAALAGAAARAAAATALAICASVRRVAKPGSNLLHRGDGLAL